MLIITGQSKAKKRVIAFLTVFVMTGVLSEFLSIVGHYYTRLHGRLVHVSNSLGRRESLATQAFLPLEYLCHSNKICTPGEGGNRGSLAC